jgi:hypothetical protein
MTRDDIAAQVGRLLNAYVCQAEATKALRQPKTPAQLAEAQAVIEKTEEQAKVAALEIAIDSLHVLHRIADSMERIAVVLEAEHAMSAPSPAPKI